MTNQTAYTVNLYQGEDTALVLGKIAPCKDSEYRKKEAQEKAQDGWKCISTFTATAQQLGACDTLLEELCRIGACRNG